MNYVGAVHRRYVLLELPDSQHPSTRVLLVDVVMWVIPRDAYDAVRIGMNCLCSPRAEMTSEGESPLTGGPMGMHG